jgi:hypothetical protein
MLFFLTFTVPYFYFVVTTGKLTVVAGISSEKKRKRIYALTAHENSLRLAVKLCAG